jgi:glutamine---fructose-6-phosphate transaminase (isomerizing)
MCGIIGYIGNKNIQKILIQGLLRLEYRGYDSAGIALNRSSGFYLSKEKGRVLNLEKAVDAEQKGESGIGHTRWATHGGVTKENAHPHKSQDGRVCIVHNGIIENYKDLKEKIKVQGINFKSETDTEVISQLISLYYSGKTISGEDSETKDKPLESIRETIKLLRGTWGLSIMFEGDTDKIYVARNGSPLIVGLDDECSYISSDPHAIMTFTKKVIFLNDGEIGIVKKNDLELFREDGATKDVLVEYLKEEWGVGEKGDYPHFMIKEIFDQPESLRRCINGRLNKSEGSARLGGINIDHKKLNSVKLINMIGSGTAFYAAQAGCYIAQGLSGVKATPLVASEYRDNNPVVNEDMLFFAFSQSGETADTLSAVKEIKLKGGTVRGVINVVGSTIARTCGSGVYIHSGPEMSVASTKAYSNMIAAASLFSLQLARSRKLDINHGQDFADELEKIPEKVHSYLEKYENLQPKLEQAVNLIKNTKFVFFIGRGVSTSVAYEGALKLMEISYIPSIAYAGGELKHGPIALIEDGTPVVVIAPKDHHKEKTISNMQECKARGAKIILIHTEGDDIEKEADISFAVPETDNLLSPLLTILPLQLLAYKTALALNRDIDKPRNLAKSVTVM